MRTVKHFTVENLVMLFRCLEVAQVTTHVFV